MAYRLRYDQGFMQQLQPCRAMYGVLLAALCSIWLKLRAQRARKNWMSTVDTIGCGYRVTIAWSDKC